MKKMTLALLVSLISVAASASTVAIIDSGTDMMHMDIAPKAWKNELETPRNDIDDDLNGYIDDIFGWNFAEGNNLVIDYKHLGTFGADVYTFFGLQAKMLLGTITDEEKGWMRGRLADQAFLQELMKFGNFTHGTHVSGIAASEADDAKIMAVKLIPTEVGMSEFTKIAKAKKGVRMFLFKVALQALAEQQMKMLTTIGEYVNGHKVDIANGSFGTGYPQSRMIVAQLGQIVVGRELTEEEIHDLSVLFLNSLIMHGKNFVDAAPNTLFVFAAGNDGLDNDKFPTSPTNINAKNVVSVAATLQNKDIAVFSNYGEMTVDVAAPGVAIESAIPGNEHLLMSGTSQAAPYVANVAAKIKDANPALTPALIKKILMGTVDYKAYLTGKVAAGGVVNSARAILAAELSVDMPIGQAINQSIRDIADVEVDKSDVFSAQGAADFVLPLRSMFELK